MIGEENILIDEDMEPDPELNRITNAIIGAAIAVHRVLGPGFPESVYQNALRVEFVSRRIVFQPQCIIQVEYRGELVGQGKMDFLVEGKVIIEIKAVDNLASIHTAQMISYLRATRHKLGLLINFNVRRLADGINVSQAKVYLHSLCPLCALW